MIESHSGWHWLHYNPHSPAITQAYDHLHRITRPTLIVVGEGDIPYYHKIANVLAVRIPGAQKMIVPDTGHIVNMEAPDEINNLLADFIATS